MMTLFMSIEHPFHSTNEFTALCRPLAITKATKMSPFSQTWNAYWRKDQTGTNIINESEHVWANFEKGPEESAVQHETHQKPKDVPNICFSRTQAPMITTIDN